MKKSLAKIFVACFALGLGIGIGANNMAISDIPTNFRVAVVDVSKIVSGSRQVQALKDEQMRNKAELEKYIQTARADVEKQTTAVKKKQLTERYDKELNAKRKTMQMAYNQKLKKIEDNINTIIAQRAKAEGYNLILSKSMVLFGGTDITSSISQYVR